MIVVISMSALFGWLFMIVVSGPLQIKVGHAIAKAKEKFGQLS